MININNGKVLHSIVNEHTIPLEISDYNKKTSNITNNSNITSESSNLDKNTSINTSESSDQDIDYSDNLDLEGKILRNYNIIYEIGKGAYSIVWLVFSIINKNFYALKVQDPNDFEDGLEEVKFVTKLSKKINVFNTIIEYFIENVNNKKYLCSIWNLHCCNIDSLIRKTEYKLSLTEIKKIMKQLIIGIHNLHTKMKVFHGDIKTDNILLKGINNKDEYYIAEYTKLICNNLLNKNDKNIRLESHKSVLDIINLNNNITLDAKYLINEKYLKNINISLADFGTFCNESTYYNNSFGTRYYQAPEIILLGKCSYPVDIWALGCTFFELLTNNILFDPIKDSIYDRNYYHLLLIQETCNNFPISFLKSTDRYKKYFNSNFKLNDYTYTSCDRLKRKLSNLELSEYDYNYVFKLLKSMLIINPDKRINIYELNNDSWFIK